MNRAMMGLFVVLAMSLLGQTLKRLAELGGIPNVFPIARDFLLIAIFVWSFGHIALFSNARLLGSLILFLFLFVAYIMISVFEDRHFLGLYYARVYLLPIFFFVAMHITLKNMNFEGVVHVLQLSFWFNAVLLLAAFFLYAIVQFLPGEKAMFFGSSLLPTAWYISGGTFMRMGLPFTGPNNLGAYLGLSLLMVLLVILALPSGTRGRKIYMLLAGFNIIALVATFSRSALVMVILGGASLLLVPALRRGRVFSRILVLSVSFFAVLVAGGLLVELMSEGFVSRWIALNLNLQDPSLRGHWHSIESAYHNFYQYALYGYDRGTVGPKAFIFSGSGYNVENSVLGVIYDFGVIGAFFFFLGYTLLLSVGYRTRLQLPLLLGFFINMQFLPFIFEPEIISFFIFIFLLAGHLDRVGFFSWLYETSEHKPIGGSNQSSLGKVKRSGVYA
jgi:hypothetical protein